MKIKNKIKKKDSGWVGGGSGAVRQGGVRVGVNEKRGYCENSKKNRGGGGGGGRGGCERRSEVFVKIKKIGGGGGGSGQGMGQGGSEQRIEVFCESSKKNRGGVRVDVEEEVKLL